MQMSFVIEVSERGEVMSDVEEGLFMGMPKQPAKVKLLRVMVVWVVVDAEEV